MSRSSSSSVAVGTQETKRRSDGVVVTKLVGRVDVALLHAFGDAYCAIGGGPRWIIDAMDLTSYEPAAVAAATASFPKWAQRGLERLFLATGTASVRMAAASVRLPVRLAARVDITVHESLADAERALLAASSG